MMSKVCCAGVPSTSSVGARVVVERDDREQHEHGAGQRVEEELDGRVLLARPAPDADEEVHRQEHHLPEHVEEEEVEREEDAHHAVSSSRNSAK